MFTVLVMNPIFFLLPIFVVVFVILFFFRKAGKAKNRIRLIENFSAAKFTSNDDLAWYIAHDVMGKAGFDDCVVYSVDQKEELCRQIAAFGAKNPEKTSILNPINIPFGRGIVGFVAMNGKTQKVNDTTMDNRYVPDDDVRYSELCVPVMKGEIVRFVIDSENRKMNYFSDQDQQFVEKIAELAAGKIQ